MSDSGMQMTHDQHSMHGGGGENHHLHHGPTSIKPQMDQMNIVKPNEEMSTLMSDRIHHHLAESFRFPKWAYLSS